MRLTLRQLEIFVAVAHSGSTVGAAQSVALSQSATSGAVIELERALNTRLFDRIGKRLLLNEHGRDLLPRAMALVDGAVQIEQSHADGAAGQVTGLRIAASTTIGNYVLPRLLASYRAALGASGDCFVARTRVLVANTADVAAAIVRFEADVGFIEGPCHEPDVSISPWLNDELLILGAPLHAIVANRSKRTVTVKALNQARWLLREPGWVVADFLEAGKLVELEPPWPRMRRHFYIVMHERKQRSPGLRHFLDYTRAARSPTGRA